MKKKTRIRLAVFAVILFAVFGIAALSTSAVLAEGVTKSIVRLSVVNTSQFDFYIYLYGSGGVEYTLSVPAGTDEKIFIQPGEYQYYMEACNYSKFGSMDLSTFQTIHVPVCGGRAAGFKHKPHHIDVSTIIKPIRIKVRNKTGDNVGVYLRTVDDHHFLNLVPGEVLEVFLRKEEGVQYVYSFQACGGKLITGYYTPLARIALDLKCP